mgnify:CR=1 FL=1
MRGNNKKLLALALSTAFMLSTVAGCGGGSGTAKTSATKPTAPIVIHMAATVPDNHSYTPAAKAFAKEVTEKTNGAVTPIVEFGGVHGGDVQTVQDCIRGTLEMTWTSDIGLSGVIPELGFTNMPYLFKDYSAVDSVYRNGWVGDIVKEKAKAKGIIVLAIGENEYRGMTNSVRPITKVSDLKNLKLRVPENPLYMDLYKRCGVLPTPMAITEVATALQQGTIDGQDNGACITATNGFGQFQKYATKLMHIYSGMDICISQKTWDKLTPEQQKIVQTAATKAADMQVKQNRKDQDKFYKQLSDEGVQVIDATPELTSEMKAIAAKMYTDPSYAKQFGQDVMKKVQEEAAK